MKKFNIMIEDSIRGSSVSFVCECEDVVEAFRKAEEMQGRLRYASATLTVTELF